MANAMDTDSIAPHRFVESGPGQEPVTIKGLIVCGDCLQPKRSAAHTTSGAHPFEPLKARGMGAAVCRHCSASKRLHGNTTRDEIADMIADCFGRSVIDCDYDLAERIIARITKSS